MKTPGTGCPMRGRMEAAHGPRGLPVATTTCQICHKRFISSPFGARATMKQHVPLCLEVAAAWCRLQLGSIHAGRHLPQAPDWLQARTGMPSSAAARTDLSVRSVSSCFEFRRVPSTSVAINLMSGLTPAAQVAGAAILRTTHRGRAACKHDLHGLKA